MDKILAFLKKDWWKVLLVVIAIGMAKDRWDSYQRTEHWKTKLSAAGGKKAGSDADKPYEGLSDGCLAEERNVSAAGIEKKVAADQERLAKMGVLTQIVPTVGPLGASTRLVLDQRAPKTAFPPVGPDIIAQLGMTIDNQFDGKVGVTDAAIRGMADRSFGKIGMLDEKGLRGYVLSVRMMDGPGGNTTFDVDRKVAIVNVGLQNVPTDFEHEFAHVLSGPDFLMNQDIAAVAKETVAIAAESLDPPGLREQWTYERQNMPILGMGKTINGESGVIHASNAPLDGWRYDSMRLVDEVIGEAAQVSLARTVWKQASERKSMGLRELEALYVAAGAKDLAIFRPSLEPGLYLDLSFEKNGVPVLLAKTVDQDGYEGISPAAMQVVWRDADGKAMGGMDPIPMQPAFSFDDAALMASYASALEVRISGAVYTFQLEPTLATSSKTSSAPAAQTVTKFIAP
ncbi:MAG: hypothetical protein WCO25_03230 [Candidatus Uhrbacteria bacterium]